MNSIMLSILLVLIGIFIGVVSILIFNYIKKNNANNKAEKIIEKAKKEADKIKRDTILETKEEVHKLVLWSYMFPPLFYQHSVVLSARLIL